MAARTMEKFDAFAKPCAIIATRSKCGSVAANRSMWYSLLHSSSPLTVQAQCKARALLNTLGMTRLSLVELVRPEPDAKSSWKALCQNMGGPHGAAWFKQGMHARDLGTTALQVAASAGATSTGVRLLWECIMAVFIYAAVAAPLGRTARSCTALTQMLGFYATLQNALR